MKSHEREELERRAAELAADRRQHGNYEPAPVPFTSSDENKIVQVQIHHKTTWLVAACWVLTVVGSLLGIVIVGVGMLIAQSAPQEAVVVALGIACAVVPYCLARAVSELSK